MKTRFFSFPAWLLAAVAAAAALLPVSAPAGNIAPQGVGIMGAGNAGLGWTIHHHYGLLSHIRDGNPATWVTNFEAGYEENYPYGWAGVGWPAARTDSVKSITVTLATFVDGGWFGSREIPAPGSALATRHLRQDLAGDVIQEPIVQITRGAAPNYNGSWITVASSSDYVAAMSGHVIPGAGGPPTTRAFTITLRERPLGITGIRVIGPMGGSTSHGFLGVSEMVVESDPVTDADNDQMDDAWEAANGLNVGLNDANTDGDDDDLVTLDEFIWRTNAQAKDTDGDGIQDGLEGGSGTHPNTADTDGDGLSDGAEKTGAAQTEATRADSDRDGLRDDAEISAHLTNPIGYDSDSDGFSDGQEIRLSLDPLSAASRLPNLTRAGRGIMGRNVWASGSPTFLQRGGTSLGNGGDATRLSDGSLLTYAHSGGNSFESASLNISNASHAGVLMGARLRPGVTATRIEVTFATFAHGGWFGTSGPGAGGTLTAAHLVVPELQVGYGDTWGTVPATTDYLARLTGHTVGSTSVPTYRSAVFTFHTPQRIEGVRVAGRHYRFLAVSDISITCNLDAGDTDADGLSESDETTRGTSPVYQDTDGDGLSDFDEVNTHLTQPLTADSDGDTFPDGHEIHAATDPLSAAAAPSGPLVLHPAPGISWSGTGLMGTRAGVGTTLGNPVLHAGSAAHITDENLITRVDSWNGAGNGDTHSYVGVSWLNDPQTVALLRVRFAAFVNGGWFGPTNTGPAAGGLLTAAHLAEPVVQVRYGSDTAWTTVPHTSDYLAVLPGHPIGDGIGNTPSTVRSTSPTTFRLDPPQQNVNAVRLIGPEGGIAEGFIGVYDFAAFAAAPAPPSPLTDHDTDDDGLPDAWELEKYPALTTADAATDSDHDGSGALLEYAFGLNPHAFDAPPSPALENGYLTMTLTKRPWVTYQVVSGGNLLDFSAAGTVILTDDTLTLKARDTIAPGSAPRRFLRAIVTATP